MEEIQEEFDLNKFNKTWEIKEFSKSQKIHLDCWLFKKNDSLTEEVERCEACKVVISLVHSYVRMLFQ